MSSDSDSQPEDLAQGAWLRRVKVPPARATAFARFGVTERRRNLRDALIIGLLLHAAVMVSDFWVVPNVFWTVETLRWLVLLPLGALLAVHLHRASARLWVDQLLVAGFCLCAVALITYAAIYPGTPIAQGYLIGNYAVVAFAATAMALPLFIAGGLAAIVMGLTCVLALVEPNLQAALGIPNIIAGVCIVVPSLFANWSLENERRRQFVLVSQEKERARTIADQRDLLARLAALDPLTGLSNRRGFDAGLAGDLERAAPDALLATAMIDIDHFKDYNDHFGHVAGDAALQRIATQLAETIGNAGRVARIGGEEFAVVMVGRSIDRFETLVENCRQKVEALAIVHPRATRSGVVTISVGMAVARIDNVQIDALMKSADSALYDVKLSGRNGVARRSSAKRPIKPDIELAEAE